MNDGLLPFPGASETASTELLLICPWGGVKEQAEQLIKGDTLFIDLVVLGQGNVPIHIRYIPDEPGSVLKEEHRELIHLYGGSCFEIDPLSRVQVGREYECTGMFGTETTALDVPHGKITITPKE